MEGTLSGHLTPADLASLVDGFEEPAEAFTSLLHLRLCRDCRVRLVNEFPADGPALVHEFNLDCRPQPLLASVSGVRGPRRADRDGSDAAISASLESWVTGSKAVAAELLAAPTLAEDLERIAPARQHLALEARRFQTLGLAVYLLRRSSALWNERPTESCRLAQLALTIISKLDPNEYPLGLKGDMQCKALAYLGNSLRLLGRLCEAEEKLSEALDGMEQGTADRHLQARVLALSAQLHRDLRRFPQAETEACKAKAICEALGDLRQVAMLVLVHASILAEVGDIAAAIQELEDLLQAVPGAVMGEAVYWAVRQNLCQSLVEGDRLWEARGELKEVKRWARRTGKTLITARTLWVEALLTAREGDPTGAALRLQRVRDLFLRNDLPYDAALACLDLAALYLRKGRLGEAQELASVLAPVFRASGIQREALASLRLLADALGKKTATTAQVEALQRHLTRQRRREHQD